MKEYLRIASDCLENAHIEFETICYPTAAAALEAVKSGEVDCAFPANLTDYDGESQGFYMTPPLMRTDMYAVIRASDRQSFAKKDRVTVAVNAGNTNYDLFLLDHFPNWRSIYFKDTPEGLKAIADGKVDCLLISNFRYNNISALCQKYKLVTLSAGVEMDYFLEYAGQMYREHPGKPMDAIVLNVEQFHSVNAVNGRDFGDHVLRELGEGIGAFLQKKGGIASHEESDHFAIYCPHMENYRALYDQLQERLNALASNSGIQLRMGVMPWQGDMDPQQMLEQALAACSLARGYFQGHLVVYNEKVRERELLEQRLLSDLRRAVDNRELEVDYQPKYDIQSEPPMLKSAEALVRWRHPELGMVSPGDFIPLFERNGQIGIVDKYVWSEAARQIAAWKGQYGVTIPVSVNLSRMDLFDPALESTLDTLLEENGLTHSDMKLEVTESACTENAYQVIDVVERLRKKGYEIEMDDFGSGYSSLNMLSSMPIDVLKMDRAFVSNIEHNAKDIQLVELILGIAKNLKVPVIAEGVETEAQLRLLKEKGCALVQGFYFSRPLPASEFESAFVRSLGEGSR